MVLAFSSLFGLLLIAPLIACFARVARVRVRWVYGAAAMVTATAVASGAAVAIAAWGRGFAATMDLSRFSSFPFLLSVDRLSGFFLFIVCAVSIPAVFFSFSFFAPPYFLDAPPWYWS